MNNAIDIYWLHVIVIATVMSIVVSRWRRNLLAPPAVFCFALTYSLFSDFIVRGYNEDLISAIPPWSLLRYQLLVLFVYSVAVIPALRFRSKYSAGIPAFMIDRMTDHTKCELVAWAGVFLDTVKRLAMTQWDPAEALSQSLGPRGGNAWSSGGSLGDGTFVLGLTLLLLVASGVCFSTLLATASVTTVMRARAFIGLLMTTALLYTYGSRTYLAVPLIYACIRYSFRDVSITRRLAAWAFLGVLTAVLFSLMLRYRSNGIESVLASGENVEVTKVVYHQDDSYYWILHACYVRETAVAPLDTKLFFFTIAINPIPRYFWEGKPALLNDFWGEYKPYYVTTTFLGECVALFGLEIGCFISLLVLFGIFRLIARSYVFISRPLGLGVYCVLVFYSYQCMRSMMSVTMSAYFPLALIGLSVLIGHKRRIRSRLARVGYLNGGAFRPQGQAGSSWTVEPLYRKR